MRLFVFEAAPVGMEDWGDHGRGPMRLDTLKFRPFLMEVPGLSDDDRESAARRAWWTACATLSDRGVEPEEFEVHEWSEALGRGRKVESGGFVEEAS